jgi:hypothetical protein
MLGVFKAILDLANSLLGVSAQLKSAERQRRLDMAELFEKISACLASVSREIRAGGVPHGRCGVTLMPFELTKSDGKLALASLDGSTLAPDVDKINKVSERIEQEKTDVDRVESDLSKIVEQVKTDALSPGDGLKQVLEIEQNLETKLQKAKGGAFTIYAIDEAGKWHEYLDRSVKIFDLGIHINDLAVSEEKADFKVEIDRTITVINQVLKPAEDGWASVLDTKPVLDLNPDKRSNYFRGLKGICHIGLEHEDPSQLKLAKKSLDSFREEFVANEAGAVKNRYLWRLGWRCLVISVAASLAYVYARSTHAPTIVQHFRNFFLLVAGAGVGTWLSFSLRRVIVSFLDLAALEEDRLDPFMRVLFITALTSIVGLLIWTGAVSLGIGQFTTTEFGKNGATALLIGLLLGVAERTMATAVQKRATEFGAGIGGK